MQVSRFLISITALISILITSAAVSTPQTGVEPWVVTMISGRDQVGTAPAVITDQAGRIHLFWGEPAVRDNPGGIKYARRSLEESEWSINDVLAGDARTPTAVIDPAGLIHLAYTVQGQLWYSRAYVDSAIDAKAWMSPQHLDEYTYNPQLLVDPVGKLHLVYVFDDGNSQAIKYRSSTDHGKTWSDADYFESAREDAVPFKPAIAFGPDGQIFIIWSLLQKSNYYGGYGVYFSRSDNGQDWSSPLRIDYPNPYVNGKYAWNASIAVLDRGDIHVVWDAHIESGQRYHQQSTDGGITWSKPQKIWDNFISQTGPNPMVVNGSSLYLFSSGTSSWEKPLGVYYSLWTGESWSKPQLIDESTAEPHWLQAAVCLGNTVFVTWEAREQVPPAIWAASTAVDGHTFAPIVYPTQAIPTDESNPTTEPLSVVNDQTSTPDTFTISQKAPADNTTSTGVIVFLSILPITAIIGAWIIDKVFRARH